MQACNLSIWEAEAGLCSSPAQWDTVSKNLTFEKGSIQLLWCFISLWIWYIQRSNLHKTDAKIFQWVLDDPFSHWGPIHIISYISFVCRISVHHACLVLTELRTVKFQEPHLLFFNNAKGSYLIYQSSVGGFRKIAVPFWAYGYTFQCTGAKSPPPISLIQIQKDKRNPS